MEGRVGGDPIPGRGGGGIPVGGLTGSAGTKRCEGKEFQHKGPYLRCENRFTGSIFSRKADTEVKFNRGRSRVGLARIWALDRIRGIGRSPATAALD